MILLNTFSNNTLIIAGAVFAALVVAFLIIKKRHSRTKVKSVDDSIKLKSEELAYQQKEKLVTLEEALYNTKKGFIDRIHQVFSSAEISTQKLNELEEVLYTSDLGPKTVQRFLSLLEDKKELTLSKIKTLFRDEMSAIFSHSVNTLNYLNGEKPNATQIWMIVGVNGAGKTTTIGKLAHHLSKKGLKVMIAAGDTFRAAAKDQLQVWAERSRVDYFSPPGVDNPSAVAFDACKKAQHENVDILIVDTAGRLHTQSHLMDELKKMKRVISNHDQHAPHEILIVLDANSGQNALLQAKQFHEALNLTGVVLTKLDGTAKGGVAVGVVNELRIPIKLIGVGESIEDLRPFNAQEFVNSII